MRRPGAGRNNDRLTAVVLVALFFFALLMLHFFWPSIDADTEKREAKDDFNKLAAKLMENARHHGLDETHPNHATPKPIVAKKEELDEETEKPEEHTTAKPNKLKPKKLHRRTPAPTPEEEVDAETTAKPKPTQRQFHAKKLRKEDDDEHEEEEHEDGHRGKTERKPAAAAVYKEEPGKRIKTKPWDESDYQSKHKRKRFGSENRRKNYLYDLYSDVSLKTKDNNMDGKGATISGAFAPKNFDVSTIEQNQLADFIYPREAMGRSDDGEWEGGAAHGSVGVPPEDIEFWSEFPPELVEVLLKFRALNREMERKKRPPRYVTVRPVGQLCNRLMAITSGFVFALLTKRGLKFEDQGDFYCSLDKDLFENPGWDWVDSRNFGAGGGSHTIENPFSGRWSEMEPLLCSNYTKHYSDKHGSKNIHFASNQFLVPYFSNNPHYMKALQELFNGDRLFPAVIRFLFRPQRSLRKMKADYIEEHFKGNFVVGMQVRSGGDFTDHFMSEKDWHLYRDCAQEVSGIASSNAEDEEDGDSQAGKKTHLLGKYNQHHALHGEFHNEGKKTKKDEDEPKFPVKFFVATDTEKGRTLAKKHLGADRVIFGPGPFLLSNNPKGVRMALLDLMLLGASDDRVNTAWSSYGYFSQGLGGHPANLVSDQVSSALWVAPPGKEQRFMGVPHKSDKRVHCVRLKTVEPCFHKFASWGASESSCFTESMFEREMLNGRYC